MEIFKKIEKIILAGALGDAFGFQVEFDNLQTIQKDWGINGIHYGKSKFLQVSDDTQMTLFFWEKITDYLKETTDFDMEEMTRLTYQGFLDWYITQTTLNPKLSTGLLKFNCLYKRQAPGVTCLNSLGSGCMGALDIKINDSKGCGSVMRLAPILFLAARFNLKDEQIFELGARQAAITHSHEDGLLASGFLSLYLWKSLNEQKEILAQCQEITKKQLDENPQIYGDGIYFMNYLKKLNEKLKDEKLLQFDDLTQSLGEGWVAEEAMGVAIYCAQKSQSFKQCLELSTNHSGDSDSTASIAAQIYASKHGLSPMDIAIKLDIQEVFNYLKERNLACIQKAVEKKIMKLL